jgi:hypothetical protein
LEVWVWSDSSHVDTYLGWREQQPKLRDWLQQSGWLAAGQSKPARPKEAVEAALRKCRKPRSSAIYFELARHVSFQRCADPAFHKLLATLRSWFPAIEESGTSF